MTPRGPAGPDQQHSVTMAEIARRAGVHVSTVSRALSAPESPPARAETLEIRRVADELGFRPNPSRPPCGVSGRMRSGCWFLGSPTTSWRASTRGSTRAPPARASRPSSATPDRSALRLQRLEEFLGRRPDGLVLGDARLPHDPVLDELDRRGIPYVLTSRRQDGRLSVTTDDVQGGRLAGQHLVALGHTEVGVVAGEAYASTGVDRTAGFRAALAEAGTEVPDDHVLLSRFDTEGGRVAADALLARHPGLTAIFAVNDTAAIGVMGAVRASGRVVGTEVSVVGYNDIPLAAELPVPLTTVASPMFEMGVRAADLLISRIAGDEVHSVLLEPQLRVRESTTGGRG